VDNIEMDLREIGGDEVDWMDVAQDKDQCDHGIEPSGSIKYWEDLEWLHN
jgi:hypothetical protein